MDNDVRSLRLGDVLLEKGMITDYQLERAIAEQQKRRDQASQTGTPYSGATALGEILIELGFIDRRQLKKSLRRQFVLRKTALALAFIAPMTTSFSASAGPTHPLPDHRGVIKSLDRSKEQCSEEAKLESEAYLEECEEDPQDINPVPMMSNPPLASTSSAEPAMSNPPLASTNPAAPVMSEEVLMADVPLSGSVHPSLLRDPSVQETQTPEGTDPVSPESQGGTDPVDPVSNTSTDETTQAGINETGTGSDNSSDGSDLVNNGSLDQPDMSVHTSYLTNQELASSDSSTFVHPSLLRVDDSDGGDTGTATDQAPTFSAALDWSIPSTRVNGEPLQLSEIGGYEIRYKNVNDDNYIIIKINDGYAQSFIFDELPEGDYQFMIAVYDTDGVYSDFDSALVALR